MTVPDAALEAGALAWVNEIRAGMDAAPLTSLCVGQRWASRRCPIARSLPGAVVVAATRASIYRAGEIKPWVRFLLPLEVQRFIQAVDEGKYPHLIKGEYQGLIEGGAL